MSTCVKTFISTVKALPPYYAYYKCEEAALPIIDSIAGRNFTTGFFPARVAGKIDYGYDLIGVGKYVYTAISNDFKFLTGDFTIRCWYYEPVSWNFLRLLTNDPTGDESFQILINDDPLHHGPTWKMWDALGTEHNLVHNAAITPGWHRIIVWHDNGVEMGLKVDDLADETTPQAGGIYEPTDSGLLLGYNGVITEHVLVDELAVWNRKLTAAEMTADWNGGAGRTYP